MGRVRGGGGRRGGGIMMIIDCKLGALEHHLTSCPSALDRSHVISRMTCAFNELLTRGSQERGALLDNDIVWFIYYVNQRKPQ